MEKHILTVFYNPEEDLWAVDFAEFPTCSQQGRSLMEALLNGVNAITNEGKVYKTKGLPEPLTLQLIQTKKYI